MTTETENDTIVFNLDDDETAGKPKTEELVVELEGNDKGEGAPNPKPDTEDPADVLKRQLEETQARETAERERAQRAEREAAEARRAAADYQTRDAERELQIASTAIESAKHEADAAARELKEALEAGNYEEVVKAQRRVARTEQRLQQMEDGLEIIKARRNLPPPTEGRVQPQPPADPVEAMAHGRSAKTAAWIRAHPTVATDPRLNKKAVAAHMEAEADGIAPDTDEYFARIEERLGFKQPEQAPPAQKQKSVPPPAAPGTPSAHSASTGRQADGKIRLPPAFAEAAKEYAEANSSNPKEYQQKLREYAVNFEKLKREGRLETVH
jgi:hypothetical protein